MIHVRISWFSFLYKKLICLDFTSVSLFRVRGSYHFDSANFSNKLKFSANPRLSIVNYGLSKVRKLPFVFSLLTKMYGGNHNQRCVISLAF